MSLALFGSLDRILAGLREIRVEQASLRGLIEDIVWRQAHPEPAPPSLEEKLRQMNAFFQDIADKRSRAIAP